MLTLRTTKLEWNSWSVYGGGWTVNTGSAVCSGAYFFDNTIIENHEKDLEMKYKNSVERDKEIREQIEDTKKKHAHYVLIFKKMKGL